MERNHDTVTSLPSVVQSFQSLSMTSTILNFGREFSSEKTMEEISATINQCLELHRGNKITRFCLFFSPLDMFLPDIKSWIEFATSKGVEEMDLDFSGGYDTYNREFKNGGKLFKLQNCLFSCESLTHLSLSCCIFCPPPDFTSFVNLNSLSLMHVNIKENVLHSLLLNSRTLENLKLVETSLESIKVSSPDLRLKNLIIVNNWEAYEVEVNAPELQSFIYYGECYFNDVKVPYLVDAFISSVGFESSEPEHDYIRLLLALAHVKILTVCTATLLRVSVYEDFNAEDLPIQLPNLRELQLLMNVMREEELACIYSFFRLCPSPFIEKLFIQLPKIPEDLVYRSAAIQVTEEPIEVTFDHLKAIKLSNFKGSKSEMRLVRFLLEKATTLQILVLVAPKHELKVDMEQYGSVSETKDAGFIDLEILFGHLASLPKASPAANIVLCEYMDDDQSLSPTHKEYYCDF